MKRLGLCASLIATTVLTAGCASLFDSHADHHAHAHADRPLPDSVQTAHVCRAGAFLEAASIINSTVDIAMALPPNTTERTRAELDTILYTALKQAKSEVHCVSGALNFGYERSFAGVIKRGVALAQSRRLKQEVIEVGMSVVASLETNRRIDPAPQAAVSAPPALHASPAANAVEKK